MSVSLLQEDVVHDQLRLGFSLRRSQAVAGEGPAVIFGVDYVGSGVASVSTVTRKMLEHHHRGPLVLLPLPPHLVEVVGVAGGGAVARAGLTGGGAAHHAGLRHDGVERVDLHVDVVTAGSPHLVPHHLLLVVPGEGGQAGGDGGGQLQLPRPRPHLGPGNTAVQRPAELRQSLTVVDCQGGSTEDLEIQWSVPRYKGKTSNILADCSYTELIKYLKHLRDVEDKKVVLTLP